MRKKYNRLMATVVRDKQRIALKYFRTKEERDEFRHQVRIKEVEEHPEWSDIKKARNRAGMSIREMADFLGVTYATAHKMDGDGYNSWMVPYIIEILKNREDIQPYTVKQLKSKRENLEISIKEFCDKIGISYGMYRLIESGNQKTRPLTLKVLTHCINKIESTR